MKLPSAIVGRFRRNHRRMGDRRLVDLKSALDLIEGLSDTRGSCGCEKTNEDGRLAQWQAKEADGRQRRGDGDRFPLGAETVTAILFSSEDVEASAGITVHLTACVVKSSRRAERLSAPGSRSPK